MRRVTRLRQPLLLLPSAPSSAHTQFAPCLRTISTTAPTCSDAPKRNRLREALWKGPAPGPEDPYAQPASHAYSEEQRDIEAYEAELAELQSQKYDFGEPEPAKTPKPFSRLKVANKRIFAPREKDATGYSPAATAEGLEEIGGFEGWWDREGHWGPESVYVPYAPVARVENPDALEVLLRQAVLEALAVRQLPEGAEEKLLEQWAMPSNGALHRALKLTLTVGEDGSASVEGQTDKVLQELFKYSAKQAKRAAVARAAGNPDSLTEPTLFISEESARTFVESFNDSWKEISLADPRLKFAVCFPLLLHLADCSMLTFCLQINKRIFQLTGNRIHDAKLAQAETVGQVLSILVRPEPPKKIFQILEKSGELELPNVSVHSRRVTPIDREKSVGRWKVIVQELEERGLPITGHEHLEKHRENRWTKGGT